MSLAAKNRSLKVSVFKNFLFLSCSVVKIYSLLRNKSQWAGFYIIGISVKKEFMIAHEKYT